MSSRVADEEPSHCRFCFGTSLRPLPSNTDAQGRAIAAQCLTCFCVSSPPIRVKPDQRECPVCFDDLFGPDGAVCVTDAAAAALAQHASPKVARVCTKCDLAVCYTCSSQIQPKNCVICRGKTVTLFLTNTSLFKEMVPELRRLLAEFAVVLRSERPERNSLVWEIIVEYVKWLSIIKDAPDDPLSIYVPCAAIEDVWRLHVLCTANYAACCDLVCGQFIHYRLSREPDRPDWHSARADRSLRAVAELRRFEPFTQFTALFWGIPMQSAAYNRQPMGIMHLRVGPTALSRDDSPEGDLIPVNWHPQYTVRDIVLKAMCLASPAGHRRLQKALKMPGVDDSLEARGIHNGSTMMLVSVRATASVHPTR